jgi:FkbM family methyltransferase
MNFSGISEKTFIGKVLRMLLKLLPSQMKMSIMQGRLKGKKWIVGSSHHGCWLGSYEYNKQKLFESTVKPGSVVFDLGGHVGFYTMLASEIVGPAGRVIVFEPFPQNLHYLRQHIEINHMNNVTIIESAVCEKNGVSSFTKGLESTMGHISTAGDLEVSCVALDEQYLKGELPLPDYIKIDIEGAEYLALTGTKKILKEAHPTIFLATHGTDVHQKCCSLLSSLGYELKSIDERELSQTDEIIAIYELS